MSGYRHSGCDTQEDYQAMIAYAGFHGLDPDGEQVYEEFWETISDEERARWMNAAMEVRSDTQASTLWRDCPPWPAARL